MMMKTKTRNHSEEVRPHGRGGFSLVEALAAVSIIGIITFLALPNIVQVKEDSELQMAISRTEALNVAAASFIQAQGFQNAKTQWNAAEASSGVDPGLDTSVARYNLIAPYLSFAPANLADFMPSGYNVRLTPNWSTYPTESEKARLYLPSVDPKTSPGGYYVY